MNDSRIEDEFLLAEEAGVNKEVFGDLSECGRCDEVKDLSEFIDTECDGDVIGTCPSCGARTIIFPVS